MVTDLIAIASLIAIGFVWMWVNVRVSRTSPLRTFSLFLMVAFLLAGTLAAALMAWKVLTA